MSISLAQYNQRMHEIMLLRRDRKIGSLNVHMGPEFPTLPRKTYQEVMQTMAMYDEIIESGGEPALDQAIVAKKALQDILDFNKYAIPGTPEYTYMENWKARAASWVWPTPEETQQFDREEEELNALRHQIDPNL